MRVRTCAAVVLLSAATFAEQGIALTPLPLVDTVWAWHSTTVGGQRSAVASPERYTLRLGADGAARVRADCNRGTGRYEVNDVELRFGAIATTKVGCPNGSRGREFVDTLARVQTYRFEGIDLLAVAGDTTLHFRPLTK